jgi:lipoate-protein ligase A
MVFVGGILLDFDYQAMSRILKVPDEKFRDKIYKTMEENLTTMRRELGSIPSREEVVSVLKEKFGKMVGKFEPASLNSEIYEKMKPIEAQMTSEEFLFKKTPRIPSGVKIKEGVEVLYGLHKARGGLIRTAEEISEGKIEDITISGDFTFFPKEQLIELEGSLQKVPIEEDQIIERVETFYEREKVESPGVESKDFATTILNPVQNQR